MTDREKLMGILIDAKRTEPESVPYSEWLVECLLANGVTFAKDTDVPSKWIRVEDRLPEEGKVVMCHHKAHEYPVFCQWDESNLCWVNYSWTFGRGLITHWMPLPKPPEEEQK